MHYNKLNRGSYIETLILNGFSVMIWPRFVIFIKLSCYTVVREIKFNLESDEGESCTESSLV